MKIDQLKKVIKECVREAIQEELKDVLFESFKKGNVAPSTQAPPVRQQMQAPPMTEGAPVDRQQMRESYMNVLGDMKAGFTTQNVPQQQPLRVTSTDTASPNSSLPEGEVSMDQVMGFMNRS